jgi:enoyl-CoA hydratase/carnithine racemase
MDNLIITNECNNILTITINRFDKKNALSSSMYQQLGQALTHASKSTSIRCVIIQGNENCFCAGNDLQDFLEHPDDITALTFIDVLQKFNKPLIAAVAGPAVGIGTTLLLHCDMVFAATNSKFKLPFSQLGLCPEAGSSALLPAKVGHVQAFELLVLGKQFSAEQALNYGLINEVCKPENLLQLAKSTAETIVKLPFDSVMTSLKLIKKSHSSLEQAIQEEGKEFGRLINTDDCKNILSQFFKQP